MNTKQNWYAPKSSNHQGTIVSEGDGRTVAVAYDKADAPLLAAAPDLFEALRDLHAACEFWEDQNDSVLRNAVEAIAKARGEG